jgi:endogenous inhibitor of DNA gyrase (YacG/DUF329 family)
MSRKAWMSGVVAAAVAVFGLLTVSAANEKAADAVNAKCPLSGKDVDASKTSEVKVGLCCAGCKGKFEKDPAAALAKLEKVPNDKCPISGKAIGDASATVNVAFCCGGCKGKFDAEPAKFIGKVKGKDAK